MNEKMNKQQFWDSIRLRYGWPIPDLPVSTPCHARREDSLHCDATK